VQHLKRIEEFISGFVDALWLADELMFIVGSPSFQILKTVVRKIFGLGSCRVNIDLLVTYWKEWTTVLTFRSSRSILMEKPELSERNLFKRLDSIESISALYRDQPLSKSQLLMIAHLTSTRQLPYMGKTTEQKSQKDFIEVITSKVNIPGNHLRNMMKCARRMGRMCIHITPKIQDRVLHISLNSSGEKDNPISQGGQSKAVKDAIDKWLLEVPNHDRDYVTPFGTARLIEGIPAWKTVFRSQDETESLLDKELYQPYSFIKEQDGRFYGLDDCLAKQVLYCAYRDWEVATDSGKIPPYLKASVVPETGNKARWVTLSEYWLNTLFAPLSHLLIELMKGHPFTWSSFHRQDQAWCAVKGLLRVKYDPKKHWFLSSDLKDATNAQSMELTKVMLCEFIAGAGLPINSYVRFCIDLIGPRKVEFPDGTIVTSSRGIFMGESIAKPSLTLLNLTIAELSWLQYTGKAFSFFFMNSNLPAPRLPWRYFHIAGDDHLTIGPKEYLNLVTKIHILSGSIISKQKHMISNIYVKYTERIIDISGFSQENPSAENIIIDSVKVRLLSRGQSTLLKKDNRNVAVGKALQLGKSLKWLPSSLYVEGKILSIKDLFLIRMGAFLPSKYESVKCWYMIQLPRILGGLGLTTVEELPGFVKNSPRCVRIVVSRLLFGFECKEALKILSSLNNNLSVRGVKSILKYRDDLISQLNDYPDMVESVPFSELVRRYPNEFNSNLLILDQARADGWSSVEDYASEVTRGNLFQELLMDVHNREIFQTADYCKQVYNCWIKIINLYGFDFFDPDWDNIPGREINQVLNRLNWTTFINVNQMTTFDIGHYDSNEPETETFDFVDMPLIQGFSKGFPNMIVGRKFLGF
jgi:hypothetical protein